MKIIDQVKNLEVLVRSLKEACQIADIKKAWEKVNEIIALCHKLGVQIENLL